MSSVVLSSIEDQELVQKRRQQLVAAATELFGRTSYDDTTMKQISKKAGFSSGLIYSYVQTKEDVLFLVLQNILDSYLRDIPKAIENIDDPIDRFCRALRAYCNVVDANAEATLLAYRSTKALGSERKAEIKKKELETNRLVAECVQSCVDAGYFRPVKADLVTYQVVMLAHSWALKSWVLKQTMSLDEYVGETVDLFLHGLMTEAGWEHWRTVAPEAP